MLEKFRKKLLKAMLPKDCIILDKNNIESIIPHIVDGITLNKKFNDYIDHQIQGRIDLDQYTFDKKLKLSSLRNSQKYNDILTYVRNILNNMIDNYIIKKYRKTDETGWYAKVDITLSDKKKDLNEIYDKFVTVVNTEIIEFDLGLYFDLYSVQSKEFFITTFIESMYVNKITKLMHDWEDAYEEMTKNPIDIMPMKEKTELENKIDDLLKGE